MTSPRLKGLLQALTFNTSHANHSSDNKINKRFQFFKSCERSNSYWLILKNKSILESHLMIVIAPKFSILYEIRLQMLGNYL